MAATLIDASKTQVRKKEYFITIDSRDRDRKAWPVSSLFEVKCEPAEDYQGASLQRKFLNVRCIELVSAIFPNTNNVLDEMYLYLTIPEIDGTYEATNLEGMKAFAKLVPEKIHGGFIHAYIDEYDRPKKIFKTQGTRIDKLTIQIKKWNGKVFDFGADNQPPSPPFNAVQTSITLKITVAEPYIH